MLSNNKNKKILFVILVAIVGFFAHNWIYSHFFGPNPLIRLFNEKTQGYKYVKNSTDTKEAIDDLIRTEESASACEKIVVTSMGDLSQTDVFSSCITAFAVAKGDVSICSYENFTYHDVCVMAVALQEKNPELCDFLNQTEEKYLINNKKRCKEDIGKDSI